MVLKNRRLMGADSYRGNIGLEVDGTEQKKSLVYGKQTAKKSRDASVTGSRKDLNDKSRFRFPDISRIMRNIN